DHSRFGFPAPAPPGEFWMEGLPAALVEEGAQADMAGSGKCHITLLILKNINTFNFMIDRTIFLH
ncbi:MAG TPA: hypothetical protein PLA65_10815, partial [Spirochaetota bacterium]|nr:hypothetical protein [Spirochaetota bacterium]